MGSYPQYVPVFASGGNIYQGAYDGYSIWIPVFYAATKSLVRLRASDGAYLSTAGAVVATLAEATITLPEICGGICTDGTYLYIQSSATASIFRRLCSDGSQVGGAIATTSWVNPGGAVFAAGYAWFPGAAPYIYRVSPAGGVTAFNIGANVDSKAIKFDGTDLWVATDHGLKQVSLSGTVLASYFSAATVVTICEPAGANIWAFHDAQLTRLRRSDGAWIDAAGGISAIEVAYALSDAVAAQGLYWDGEDLWASSVSSASPNYRVVRLRGDTGVPVETLTTPYGACRAIVRAVNNLWFITGPSQYNPAVAWRYQGFLSPVVPNLTDVSPGAGPHISLTFDNAVGITGPTIGAAADGLGVTGATQISATQIDLACAIRPDHPDGDADNATLIPPIGEADPLGPPVPTGVGAVQI